jgi:hypothetical protein
MIAGAPTQKKAAGETIQKRRWPTLPRKVAGNHIQKMFSGEPIQQTTDATLSRKGWWPIYPEKTADDPTQKKGGKLTYPGKVAG